MMLRTALLLQLWSISSVYAFSNTSPFFYLSTTGTQGSPHNVPQLYRSKELLPWLSTRLSECSSDTYILVSQPGVNAADFSTASAAPSLRRRISGGEDAHPMKATIEVSDVIGHFDVDHVEAYLQQTCKAEIMKVDASTGRFESIDDMKPRVVRVDFPYLPLSQPKRADQLRQHDSFLSSLIDLLPSERYTVLYTTTPVADNADGVEASHDTGSLMQPDPSGKRSNELKRRMLSRRDENAAEKKGGEGDKKDDKNKNDNDDDEKQPDTTLVDGPLFQRYQFLTPGLFMTLLVTFLLLSILGVGINALGSLQVSYAAFEKDMGPAAHKKQQ